jgi:hypothetical protein
VTICTTPFTAMAELEMQGMGMPGTPVVTIPHPLMTRTPDELREVVSTVLPRIIDALFEGVSG